MIPQFRAWSIEHKRMSYEVEVYSKPFNRSWWIAHLRDDDGSLYIFTNGYLTQYTGLETQAGQKVWEGDLVTQTNADRVYQVMCQDYGWVLARKGGSWQIDLSDASVYEVVGHIYEWNHASN